ncbi:MAG: glycosyltransferase family 2 protein [Pseudomonadota bacterium]
MSLSVIVIARNEAHHIADCLRSAAFADELVVLDSGSTDGTQAIAQSLGAKVHSTVDWPGFGPQKNRALALAAGDWVLSLDADERVTPALKDEILAAMRTGAHEVYSFPRLSSYCGQYMRHSGWYPDRVPRLFRRGAARFSDDLVHERLVFSGVCGQLTADLLHETYEDLEAVLDKVNRYSSAGALDYAARGKSGSLGKALAHGVWAFLRSYFFRRGFLDGKMGFVLAVSNAEASYYRYLKLWLLPKSAEPSGTSKMR